MAGPGAIKAGAKAVGDVASKATGRLEKLQLEWEKNRRRSWCSGVRNLGKME